MRLGKEQKRWIATRKEWIKNNPPDYGGYWYCIVGGRALTDKLSEQEYGALLLTLDHNIPRSRAPELRHHLGNLNPMCPYHNSKKGSRSLEEYLKTKPDKVCRY